VKQPCGTMFFLWGKV